MPDCNTLIISDLHLGARLCRADKILALLRGAKFKTLVINGDLFDSDLTERFSLEHWEILSLLADVARRQTVILVGGNHGRELDNLAKKIGIELVNEYAFSVRNRRFICFHGDKFDIFIKHLPITSLVFTRLYYLIQRFGGKKQVLSIFLKRFSKRILRVPATQRSRAIKEAAQQNASVVICSHTHLPHVSKKDGILFVNSGSFCDSPCNYVTIDNNGIVELKEI